MAGKGARQGRRSRREEKYGPFRFVISQFENEDKELLNCGHYHKLIPRHTQTPGKLERHCLFCKMELWTG